MITKITMEGCASYKEATTLETQKKVNLVYGLNGVGKSTISNYLYNPLDEKFKKCRIEYDVGTDADSYEFHVFNNKFVADNFYEESLKGVFTLSGENKSAKQAINVAKTLIESNQSDIAKLGEEIQRKKEELSSLQQQTNSSIWEIKTKYADSANPLNYCFEGLKGDKQKLYDHLKQIPFLESKPKRSIEELEKEVSLYRKNNQTSVAKLQVVLDQFSSIEKSPLLTKHIVGGTDSVISDFINEMKCSDWVKSGSSYLKRVIESGKNICPFCQTSIDVNILAQNIEKYFDKTYENDISNLKRITDQYNQLVDSFGSEENTIVQNEHLLGTFRVSYMKAFSELKLLLQENVRKLEEKSKNPGNQCFLEKSSDKLNALNSIIEKINTEIEKFNKNLSKSKQLLEDLKKEFWSLMRCEKNDVISGFETSANNCATFCGTKEKEINKKKDEISVQKSIISVEERKVVNVHEAVENINNGLVDIGITSFRIVEAENEMYQIEREGQRENIFKSLSEGEKMMISLLYFIETCKGSYSGQTSGKKKIIVIDDPISSLSHIYVFNAGMLLKKIFTSEDPIDKKSTDAYEQIFILTHNLYFFYEMVLPKRKKDGVLVENSQALFRVKKGEKGSKILEMGHNEVQNEYESYWSVVNAPDGLSPILQANCMRNIVEYFFGFMERKSLSDVMNTSWLREPKYQAFYRFINRESHSEMMNIYDSKEYDLSIFREALKEMFVRNGYEKHYEKMSKLR